MKNLLKLFKRDKQLPVNDELVKAVAAVNAPPPKAIKGRFVKTQHKQYTYDMPRKGGRVVKTMPRSLRKMKELADKTDDQI